MSDYTRSKRIHEKLKELYVTVEHLPSKVYGQAAVKIADCPCRLLTAVADDDWNDPLLQELEAEAMNIVWDRAKAAQSILGGIAA